MRPLLARFVAVVAGRTPSQGHPWPGQGDPWEVSVYASSATYRIYRLRAEGAISAVMEAERRWMTEFPGRHPSTVHAQRR